MEIRRTAIILFLIILLKVVLFVPFIGEPLERDEGAYGYIAQQVLSGGLPYRDAFDHKPPAVYYLYAGVFKLFGDSLQALRVFTLCFSLITLLVVFGLASYLWGGGAGLLAAFFYALFSGGPLVQGTAANTETFMVLPLLLALFCFIGFMRRPVAAKLASPAEQALQLLFLTGLFSGLAIMFKQVAIVNLFVLILFVLFRQNRWRNLVWLSVGTMVVPLIFLLYFFFQGALNDFIYGTILVNAKYLQSVPGTLWGRLVYGWTITTNIARLENGLIWVLALSGALFIVFWERRQQNLLLVLWSIASLIGVCGSGLFFGHYYIQLVPALCLLSGYALVRLKDKVSSYGWITMGLSVLLLSLYVVPFQLPFYNQYSGAEISEHKYGSKQFVVSLSLAEEMKKFVKTQDKVLVWSANPEVYFYLQKKSPTIYFNYLAWMHDDQVKQKVLSDIFVAEPDYIVWTGYGLNYQRLQQYIGLNYRFYLEVDAWKVFKRR